MYTIVIDRGDNCKGIQYQFIEENFDTLEAANLAARRAWHHRKDAEVYLCDERGRIVVNGFDSRKLRNFYIVISNKRNGEDRIIGRRKAMLFEMNDQAAWIWSLLNKREKRRYQILVQGELNGNQGFDSELL